uniref:S8 family serine peptidase n=2 Tax=Vibrio ziniensis TaxID=2711221 RepID=A0A6G7CR38_9VIBR|nr:S8 family serine peptidase [Vibrio ziniensis]
MAATTWAEGRILVQPKAGLSEEKLQQILERSGGHSKGVIKGLGIHIVEVPAQAEEAVARALAKNPNIAFAEKDQLHSPEMVANDTYYSSGWHLPKIQAPDSWDITDGSGVVVAVLDSGVDPDHPDLSSQLVSGWNTASNNTDSSDIFGHGTKVAGTIGAASNNGLGVTSVAWNVSLMPVRVTNRTDGAAYTSDITEGIVWAADNGARVANISFDYMNGSSSVISAAQYMKNKGGLVIVAAGNSGTDPGYSEQTALVTVSATDKADAKNSWSNYGDMVDISAPGLSIWTTTNGGGYGAASGTSFSSPVVAGVAALVMAANPNLSPDEVELVLEQSADDLGTPGWDTSYGHGRVNAFAAVTLALDTDTQSVDTQAPEVVIVTPEQNAQIAGLVNVDVSASDDQGVSSVSLYANGVLVATDISAPYQFSWDSTQADNGEVTLTAYAYDAADNEGISDTQIVVVDNQAEVEVVDVVAPSVSILNPANGSTISKVVSIDINANDDSGIAMVKLYIDGELVLSTDAATSNYRWNTRKVSNGSHIIMAIAEDVAGNISQTSVQVSK